MPTVSERIAKLTQDINTLRTAAKFNVGDLIKPSTQYLRAIGPTTNKKDGIVLGVIPNMRGYYIVLWNDNDQPVAVNEYAMKMKKKNFRPNPPELRQKWREYAFDPDTGGLMHKEDLAKKQKKAASYVGTKVGHAKEADDWGEMLHRMMTREPGPEEIALNKEIAVYEAVWRGISHIYHDLIGHGNLKTFGNFRKTPKKPGDKERGVSDVIRKHDWSNLRSEGIRSVRDLPKDVPVQFFIDAHYEQGGRVYDRFGYITAGGREVTLAQGRMTVFLRVQEAAKKHMPKLVDKYQRLRDQAENKRDQIPL